MNNDQFMRWLEGVKEHSKMTQTIIKDRMVLRKLMTDHLKQFFEFDEIEYDPNFYKITLKWKYDGEVIIDPEKLDGLNMDFTISHEYSDKLGEGITISLYPFGMSEEEES